MQKAGPQSCVFQPSLKLQAKIKQLGWNSRPAFTQLKNSSILYKNLGFSILRVNSSMQVQIIAKTTEVMMDGSTYEED